MSEEESRRDQWHPYFAELLRPMLQDYFSVQTNLPVGDAPREADIVLIQRTREEPTPFRGLWRHLTPWNVFEFKGPTVSARVRDLDLLVEVGLGIDRRLNEEQRRQRLNLLEPADVSFWYLTNHPGRRFLRSAQQRFGTLELIEPGLWRSQALERPLFLVSNSTIPIETETIPVHLVAEESLENQFALIRVIAARPDLWKLYSQFVASRNPHLWKEIERMARTKHKGPQFDIRPLVKAMGTDETLHQVLESISVAQVIESIGPEQLIEELKRQKSFSKLSAKKRQELKELLE